MDVSANTTTFTIRHAYSRFLPTNILNSVHPPAVHTPHLCPPPTYRVERDALVGLQVSCKVARVGEQASGWVADRGPPGQLGWPAGD